MAKAKKKEEPQEEVFVGWFKPDIRGLYEQLSKEGKLMCPCGRAVNSNRYVFEHWQLGHFDTPVTKPWGEVAAAVARQEKEDE